MFYSLDASAGGLEYEKCGKRPRKRQKKLRSLYMQSGPDCFSRVCVWEYVYVWACAILSALWSLRVHRTMAVMRVWFSDILHYSHNKVSEKYITLTMYAHQPAREWSPWAGTHPRRHSIAHKIEGPVQLLLQGFRSDSLQSSFLTRLKGRQEARGEKCLSLRHSRPRDRHQAGIKISK